MAGRKVAAQTMRHAAITKGSIMTMAKFKSIAKSVALIIGVIAVNEKIGLTSKIRSVLGV